MFFLLLAVESEVCLSMSRASKLPPLTLADWVMALLVIVRANGFNSTSCTNIPAGSIINYEAI